MNFDLEDSVQTTDKLLIDEHVNNPEFPYLISFPRSGSHWLRLLMELYFEKPSLVRSFYYSNAREFTCLHHHDLDLDIQRDNVIYLYRMPVPTIFSQLKYHRENVNDAARIQYWSSLYAAHLSKWLQNESFTKKKLVLRYEQMQTSINHCFHEICRYLDVAFDQKKFESIVNKASKNEVRYKTRHDPQVINLSESYEKERKAFAARHSAFILSIIDDINPSLRQIIDYPPLAD